MSDNLISITVDDREYRVKPGQPLIEALWEIGVETPNFCYHPDLPVAGNCRICLVEMEGPRGWALMISCHQRTAPNMKVRTQQGSPKVRWAREGVMENLLVNHPLDCPICDKAGECSLQEHYMGSGQHQSRLRDSVGKVYKGCSDHRTVDSKGQERGGKRIDLGPTIILDQERCILCSRCVRFMKDVAKDEQLGLAGRGDHAYITTFPGQPLNHDYDLCTTDLCPVGALTGKHFRFQQRVWFLKTVDTIVPDDSLGANITLEYHGQTVWRMMPRRNPAVNKSWLHNDSRLLYKTLSENRFLGSRIDGREATLADGYQAVAQRLSAAKKVAVVCSGHLTVEDNMALIALAERLGGKAELFAGSWLALGKADGLARSGDPVANRRALALLGLSDNLDQLNQRASEFDCVLIAGHDLYTASAEKAAALSGISQRLVLDSWHSATAAQATVAVGTRCWAEVRGVFVNCQDRAQVLNAVPVCPDPDLDPTWQVLVRISGLVGDKPIPWSSEIDALKAAGERAPQLYGLNYRTIGPMGQVLAAQEVSA